MPAHSDRRSAAAEDLARAGGRDAPVEIVAYDPAWPAAFEDERRRVAPLLSGVEVHHFGSTAVLGLAAKPVIDMIALVDDLDAALKRTLANRHREDREAYTDAKAAFVKRWSKPSATT